MRAAADQHVGGNDARTAGVGDDSEARAFRARLFAENFRHVEQFGNRLHAQDADTLERRLQHFIAARERTGVGRGGFRGGFRATGLDDDDWFGQGDFARGGKKRARIADGFHVDDNAFGVRIIAKMINQIAPAHVEHGTERDERTKTDVLLQAPVEDCRAKRAALADETDAPRLRHVRRKRRVKFCAGNHHA